MRHQQTAVIVVAAGSGERLGAGVPKAFVAVNGLTLLEHTLETIAALEPAEVVAVVPEGYEEPARAAGWYSFDYTVTVGGATRQASVSRGLAALSPRIETVLIHDAARAFTPREQFERVIAAVESGVGAIPGLAVVDSLKRVDGTAIVGVADRSELVAAQTPQGFVRAELVAAYAAAEEEFTDDAAVFAAGGGKVVWVPGSAEAFKVTTPADLARARRLQSDGAPRVGVGTDVHAFGGDGNLWLAGLEWPGEPALSGHSDGDAVAHAMVDALLGAAGLGDIGSHFGTDAAEFAGAHASAFLTRTAELVRDAGFAISNVSVQFQGNRPRFAPRRAEAQRVLSQALGAPVSVSATTTDGLGFPGTGEGIAAFATASLYPSPN